MHGVTRRTYKAGFTKQMQVEWAFLISFHHVYQMLLRIIHYHMHHLFIFKKTPQIVGEDITF